MSYPFQMIVGLEVHVQLATQTKLFCRCSTKYGAPPNTQVCPLCIGLPGALPVMNREAFRLGMRAALGLNLEIPTFTKWDRKSYFYPDLPKGYQISQFDLPMSQNGYLEISDPKGAFEPKRVRIHRAHLEEDAGKSMHDEAAGIADSRIDLNRCGTPLLEIVSEPDIHSAAEARAYLNELKLILTYLAVSDCNMQEGSLRVDANVNLHIESPQGKVATPIVEVKNMNSFRAVERALEYEQQRQYDQWEETGEKIGDRPKQTRGWDDAAGVTRAQREKEESSDYRYFPDPDLAPVRVTSAEIEQQRSELGELPAELRAKLESQYGLSPVDSDVIVSQGPALVAYYLAFAAACQDGKAASNWVQQDILRYLNENETVIDEFPVAAEQMGALVGKVTAGELITSRAREVLTQMIETGESLEDAMQSLGIVQVDQGELLALCQQLVAANPNIVADVKAGKMKAAGALIGQARQKNPNVDPGEVRKLCLKIIEES